jgi:hypothetical protein
MKKDYSKLDECLEKMAIKLENKNILEKKRKEECDLYNEKYIEEKYSKFLDWLIDDLTNIDKFCGNVPDSFNDLLIETGHGFSARIYQDINRYLELRYVSLNENFNMVTRKYEIHYGLRPYNTKQKQKELIKKQLVDKLKEEAMINKPITSFPDEIHALQNRIRILEEIIKEII